MAVSDLDQTIEHYHQALDLFCQGDAGPVLKIFSERGDVSLANPLGPTALGRQKVVETTQRAASFVRDGEPVRFETIVKVAGPDLAFIVEVERVRMKLGGSPDLSPVVLRVTTIFRLEDSAWKIVHRHADPIDSIQPVETIIQKQP
jgi:ketosteroid isomerase-like protein